MTVRIPERIPPHKLGLADMLDKQIEVLQQDGDLRSVFEDDDLEGIQRLGHAKYLAQLKEIRQKLGQPDGLSEE